MSTRWISALGGVWSRHQIKRPTEKAPASLRLPVAFSVFVILAQTAGGVLIPQLAKAIAVPTGPSGLYRINELTLTYNGTYYYYQEPTKPINNPDDSADMLLNNGKPDITKASGPVFSRVDASSGKTYCYDIIYYDARGGGWQRDFSTNDAGACTANQTETLPEPQNNNTRGLVTFFKNSAANTIESVRLSNATPFIRVTQDFPGKDQVNDVYIEQKAASDCPDLMIYYKSGAIGVLHPQKGTPSASDSNSAYREILRTTGSDSGQCIAPDKDATVSWLNNTFLVPKVVTDKESWVSFLNMKGSVQIITPSVSSDSSTGGLAITRAESTQTINHSNAGSSNSIDQKDDCPVDANTKLRWIICPLILLGDSAVKGIDSLLNQFLYTPTNQVFSSSFNQTADVFRNLGLALVVIAGLVMVVTQAIGMEIFSAYTVRKVLPRLVIAAIGIALARPLLEFIVTFFNDLGLLVDKLILSTVKVPGSVNTDATGILAVLDGVTIAGATTVAAIALLGPAGILSLIFTVLAALLVGLLVLAGRQLIILVAILAAPLAIAAYILPGTEKIWKFWKGALTSMLVAFPIITGFIATGKALSNVALASDSGELKFLGVLVRYLPYFMLPFAFKLAGGLMGTVFSMVNDRSKGIFDRNKKFRAGKRAENVASMKAGNRFNGNRFVPGSEALAKRVNSATMRATSKRMGFGAIGQSALAEKQQALTAEYAKSHAGQAAQFNDRLLQAQTYLTESEARANMGKDFGIKDPKDVEAAIVAAKANGGFGQTRQAFAAKQLAATGTGYDNMQQMLKTVARASGGNHELADAMVGEMRGTAERSGRNDLKASFGMMTKLTHNLMDNGGNTDALSTSFDEAYVDAARGADNMSLMRNKPTSVKNLSQALGRQLIEQQKIAADTTQDVETRRAASQKAGEIFAKIENMQNQGLYSAPEANLSALNGILINPETAPVHQGTSVPEALSQAKEQTKPREVISVNSAGETVRIKQAPNPDMQQTYDQQRQQMRYDPRDPNAIPNKQEPQ